MKNWNEWLIDLVKCFRNEVEKLSPEQKARVPNLDDLSFPCQVDVIWLQNSQFGLDFQFIIFEHFQDRPDLEISIHGPIPFYKAIDEFEQILADEKWHRELAKDERYYIEDKDKTLRTILEGRLISTIEELRSYILNVTFADSPLSPRIQQKQYLSQESFTWVVPGDIRSMSALGIVSKIIDESTKSVLRHEKQPEPEAKPAVELKAHGTYFYPSVWIGDIPKRTFKEKVRRRGLPDLPRKSFNLKYKGFQATVQEDGLIAILDTDKAAALQMLNEIMGTALLSGLPCLAVRESEIGEIRIAPETLQIRGSTMPLVSDRTRQHIKFGSPDIAIIPRQTRIISGGELENLFKRAETVTTGTEATKSVIFLLESFTHFQSSEYAQCFVMGWTVIEKYIVSLWDDFLKLKGVTGKRQDKLEHGLQWTTDHVLETLNLTGMLDESQYVALMRLKRKRNKVLHAGEIATEVDAKECLGMALNIVTASVSTLGAPYTISPTTKRFML